MEVEDGEIVDEVPVVKTAKTDYVPYLLGVSEPGLILVQGPSYVAEMATVTRSCTPSAKDDRISGGFWAKMKTIRKSTDDLQQPSPQPKPSVDAVLPLSGACPVSADKESGTQSEEPETFDELQAKYHNIETEIKEVERQKTRLSSGTSPLDEDYEEELNKAEMQARNRALSSLLKSSNNLKDVAPEEDDELSEMQLRLEALESTLQHTQSQAADLLERGQKQLDETSEPRVSPVDLEDGEIDPAIDQEDIDLRLVVPRQHDVDLRPVLRSRTNSTQSPSLFDRSSESRLSERSSSSKTHTPSSGRSSRRRRRRPSKPVPRKPLLASPAVAASPRSTDSPAHADNGRRSALNLWQQQQREKILNTDDPQRQLHEFFKMLTTTSMDFTSTSGISELLPDDSKVPQPSPLPVAARVTKMVDNYDVCSMELGSESGDGPRNSPDVVHLEVPPAEGESPPAIEPPAAPVPVADSPVSSSLCTCETQSKASDDTKAESDDEEATALRAFLLASMNPQKPPADVDVQSISVDEQDKSLRTVIDSRTKRATPDDQRQQQVVTNERYRLVLGSNKTNGEGYKRTSIITDRLPNRFVRASKHKLQVTAVRHEPLLIPIDDSESSDDEQKQQKEPTNVNAILDQCLKDARIKTDIQQANKQEQQKPVPSVEKSVAPVVEKSQLETLQGRLSICQKDMAVHRKHLQEDRSTIRALESLQRKHKAELLTAEQRRKSLLEQLAAVDRVCASHKKAITKIQNNRTVAVKRLADNERLQSEYEKQWTDIQELLVKHRAVEDENSAAKAKESLQAQLQKRKQRLELMKRETTKRMEALESEPPEKKAKIGNDHNELIPSQVLAYETIKSEKKAADNSSDESMFAHFGCELRGAESRLLPHNRTNLLECLRSYKWCFLTDSLISLRQKLDPYLPLCPFALNGQCVDKSCPWQHERDYNLSEQQLIAELASFCPSLLRPEHDSYLHLAERIWSERGDKSLERVLADLLDQMRMNGFEMAPLFKHKMAHSLPKLPEIPVPVYKYIFVAGNGGPRYYSARRKRVKRAAVRKC